MPLTDWIKLAFILPVFFVFGPLLGMAVTHKPKAQRWLFGLMCFMSINGLLAAGNWGLTLGSVEIYRGHARGYHFYFNHIFAIALMVAKWREDPKAFRWLPPGMLLYALHIIACTLSIMNAPRVDYVLMALHKMIFFALIGIASFNYVRTIEDVRFFIVLMSGTLVWEAIVVLKMKYIQRIYQVPGTFEHQNALAMYTILIAMPILAAALGPRFRGQGWCVAGFLASAAIIQGTLSRGAMVIFAGGVAMVSMASLMEKPTKRRFGILTAFSAIAALGLAFTLKTIINRFHDKGNEASGELREVLNEASRQMEADYTVGIGWNNYALVINAPYPYANVVYDWLRKRGQKVDYNLTNGVVESHYYLLIAENGYPGLITWLLVIGVALWRNLRGFWGFKHSFERCVCMGIMVGAILNYAQSTLERTLTQPRNLMLWLVIYAVTGRLELIRRARAKSGGAIEDSHLTPGRSWFLTAPPRPAPWPSPGGWKTAQALMDGKKGQADPAAAPPETLATGKPAPPPAE